MRLYDWPGAPSPRRARIVLAEKGLLDEVDRVTISLADGEQFGAAFRAVHPGATVPVLELDDGSRIADSHAIARYLEATHPEPPLFGVTPLEQASVTAWCRRIDMELYRQAADSFRNTSPRHVGRALPGWREGLDQIPALADRARRVSRRFLDEVEAVLVGAPHLAASSFTMADVDLLVGLDFAARVGLADAGERPATAAWRARVGARPSASA